MDGELSPKYCHPWSIWYWWLATCLLKFVFSWGSMLLFLTKDSGLCNPLIFFM